MDAGTPCGYGRPTFPFGAPPGAATAPRIPARAPRTPGRGVPDLGDCVVVPSGSHRVGEPGEERPATIEEVRIGRFPVVTAHVRRFAAATGHPLDGALARRLDDRELQDHPATGLTFADAEAFCAWASAELGAAVRLPTGTEWEAAARGADGRPWPWGHTFDPERCNCAEAAWGWTVPVRAHPDGAGPTGAQQLAGNVWEWVADPPDEDGWRRVRGGSYLDTAWGVRASRSLPADPGRATATTGLRIAIDPRRHP